MVDPQPQWAHQGSLRSHGRAMGHALLPHRTIRVYEYGTSKLYVHLYYPIITHENDGWAPQRLTTNHLRGHTSFVFYVNYNSVSSLLVSGGCEGEVHIWNITRGALSCGLPFSSRMLMVAGKCIKTLHAHLDYVTAVHFNRDASLIVSCSLNGLMYVPSGFIYLLQ